MPKKKFRTKKNPTISENYGSPDAMAHIGPLVLGAWSVPKELRDLLEATGIEIPPPIEGHLLIDTGASHTCIAEWVAKALNLPVDGVGESLGAHGKNQTVFRTAELFIGIQEGKKVHHVIYTRSIQSIPGLEHLFPDIKLSNGEPLRVIGLLGRDLLTGMKLTYRGSEGKYDLEFDVKAMPKAPTG